MSNFIKGKKTAASLKIPQHKSQPTVDKTLVKNMVKVDLMVKGTRKSVGIDMQAVSNLNTLKLVTWYPPYFEFNPRNVDAFQLSRFDSKDVFKNHVNDPEWIRQTLSQLFMDVMNGDLHNDTALISYNRWNEEHMQDIMGMKALLGKQYLDTRYKVLVHMSRYWRHMFANIHSRFSHWHNGIFKLRCKATGFDDKRVFAHKILKLALEDVFHFGYPMKYVFELCLSNQKELNDPDYNFGHLYYSNLVKDAMKIGYYWKSGVGPVKIGTVVKSEKTISNEKTYRKLDYTFFISKEYKRLPEDQRLVISQKFHSGDVSVLHDLNRNNLYYHEVKFPVKTAFEDDVGHEVRLQAQEELKRQKDLNKQYFV